VWFPIACRFIEVFMKVLIAGHKGQLGNDLIDCAQRRGIGAVGADRPDYDITSMESVEHLFTHAGPFDVVINAAAYTAVDRAESEADIAYAVNRDGAGHLSVACAQLGIPLIHISTDYVFGGLQTRPCSPSDPVDPRGVYARSKAAGEEAVRRHLDRHLIMRISWLFGLHGNNFVKTMLRLGREKEMIKVVDDQIGSPTYAQDLAAALLQVAEQIHGGLTAWGTYHYCNQGALTWYAFTRKIFAFARPYEKLAIRNVVSILTAHYPTPAPRPHYSVLDCSSFDRTFGIPRRPWESALKEMLATLYSSHQ
jgi:dTDP-4-dehydrorhamnose reductase